MQDELINSVGGAVTSESIGVSTVIGGLIEEQPLNEHLIKEVSGLIEPPISEQAQGAKTKSDNSNSENESPPKYDSFATEPAPLLPSLHSLNIKPSGGVTLLSPPPEKSNEPEQAIITLTSPIVSKDSEPEPSTREAEELKATLASK